MSNEIQLNSSLLQSYSYDPKTYVLTVTYKTRGNKKASYVNVFPSVISQVFDGSGSVGSRFLKLIAKNYMQVASNP
jgi:hypothetical protein